MGVKMITSIKRYIGTESERSAMSVGDLPIGSTFYESDTGSQYVFNGTDWTENATDKALTDAVVSKVVEVTPSDSEDLTNESTGVYVGGTGDIKVDLAGAGTEIVLKGIVAGVWHPLKVKKVYSTDTTATDILISY